MTTPNATTWVERLCRHLEAEVRRGAPIPTLDALADRVSLSKFHLQRTFKAVTGVSPRAYAKSIRVRHARTELERAPSVTRAVMDGGFQSTSRFHEEVVSTLGMTPTRFRKRGAGLTIRFAGGQSALGARLVAGTERGICSIALGQDAEALVHELDRECSNAHLVGNDGTFERWVAEVAGLVHEPRPALDLPLDIRGTAFQRRVWTALRAIPPGTTLTYAEVAKQIGHPLAARAVASACAANRLALVIPCHRVVRRDRALTGYRWGIERKRALLRYESRFLEEDVCRS